jgi:site-specific recombinase XerD
MIEASRSHQHRALVALCGLCGLRVAEAISVKLSDIDTKEMVLFVHGKGDKKRWVPLSDKAWRYLAPAAAEAMIARRARVVTMADRTAREVITRLAVEAGLTRHVSSHDLRATFGTAAYAKTKDLRAVQDLLGHASSKTTETYTGVSERAMRDAADIA